MTMPALAAAVAAAQQSNTQADGGEEMKVPDNVRALQE